MAGLKLKPKLFGTGLPPAPHPTADYSNVFHPDKTAAPAAWETVTQSFHQGPGSSKVASPGPPNKQEGG